MKPLRKTRALAFLSTLALAISANAATYVIDVNNLDAEVGNASPVGDGGGGVSNAAKNGTLLAGAFNTSGISPVFAFALPTLAPGETISGISLRYRVSRASTLAFNADLYGLPYRATANAAGGDYFTGTLDATNATLLVDNLATPSTSTTAANFTTTASSIADYITAQYTAGAVGGNFIFFRTSADFTTLPSGSASRGYQFSSGETGSATRMQLTITTVPEPSTAGLLGICGALALFRRGRAS